MRRVEVQIGKKEGRGYASRRLIKLGFVENLEGPARMFRKELGIDSLNTGRG